MATVDDKENVAPDVSIEHFPRKLSTTPSPKKIARKGRSKSIGPGGLAEGPQGLKDEIKLDLKNRRKSAYVGPATKAIISSDIEKAERQAARRRTLANRRVSFAPEATLHTWDVVEFMRDQTTSTESEENTRRTSKGASPYKRAPAVDSDPPSTPASGDEDTGTFPAAHKQRRRSPSFGQEVGSDADDGQSSSGESGSSDAEESGDEDAEGSEDDTGTAMSLDVDNNTLQSLAESEASSTSSSARLDAALRQAAQTAGTRGIEYDEYGDQIGGDDDDGDASMDIAGEEITNALKPWVEQRTADQQLGSASLDQENVNPFSPAFKAQLNSGVVNRPSTVAEEDTADMSMDVTKAMGGVLRRPDTKSPDSVQDDATMDFTQAVGNIRQPPSPQTRSGQKRRRSTTDAGSPGAAVFETQSKRRRSSVARSSMGDDTMDLTIAVGGIQNAVSPVKSDRRKSMAKRRSSGAASEQDEATMDFTQAIGGIKGIGRAEVTTTSVDSNEELTMELTTVLGGIKAAAEQAVSGSDGLATPLNRSPAREAKNTTPKDQERFKDAPDSGPRRLLTPMLQKQVLHSAEKPRSSGKKTQSSSPKTMRSGLTFAAPSEQEATSIPLSLVPAPSIPSLGDHKSPLRATPTQQGVLKQSKMPEDSSKTQMQLDAQLQGLEPSPTALKQQRSTPAKVPATPEKAVESSQQERRLVESIKLMSTPRKEMLKSLTPKHRTQAAQPSPHAAPSSRPRATPKAKTVADTNTSPNKQLTEDLDRLKAQSEAVDKIPLQKFLDLAGIRFMDLTTTKRRMTHAVTPSKAKKAAGEIGVPDEEDVTLSTAIQAAACTLPELEMYEHACHELKRYISSGKTVIKDIESDTARSTPPLIQAYLSAGPKRKAVIDAQMRDIKTQARGRSKEMWYAWRTQLLEDLMRGLQGVGEGLIRDDEVLVREEGAMETTLPELVEREIALKEEAERLELLAEGENEEEKAELEEARERLSTIEQDMSEKRKVLEELQRKVVEQQTQVAELMESKEEFVAAINEADRMKEACRSVSASEISTLQDSVTSIEDSTGWSIVSASSKPTTTTMTYKSHLQLFFHPNNFNSQRANRPSAAQTNAPISLTYTAATQPTTSLRFFLQLLRASLQALPQHTTTVPALLNLISSGWDTALAVAEAERQLKLEAPTSARILSDERLLIESEILLRDVRTKVRVGYEISAAVAADQDDGSDLKLSVHVQPAVKVVYGEPYNETKMQDFVQKNVGGEVEGWDAAVRHLRTRLIARGAKGAKV